MKRNKAMKRQKSKRGTYRKKREFLVAENNRRATYNVDHPDRSALPGVMGMDYPVGAKPWK